MGAATIAALGTTVAPVSALAMSQTLTWHPVQTESQSDHTNAAVLGHATHHRTFHPRLSQERVKQLEEFHQLLSDGKEAEARAFAKANHLKPPHQQHWHTS